MTLFIALIIIHAHGYPWWVTFIAVLVWLAHIAAYRDVRRF
jgi:hypothetical protein